MSKSKEELEEKIYFFNSLLTKAITARFDEDTEGNNSDNNQYLYTKQLALEKRQQEKTSVENLEFVCFAYETLLKEIGCYEEYKSS